MVEIPYIFKPRKDTGLCNSKIAIWLFLASEVMLFGGLFSSYIFLRVFSDYPWPERTLPVLPGLINTVILIISSVTVVFAWAALKLRKWSQFQFYMAITLICAAFFMGLKALEYKAKFNHQAARLSDFTVVEGHLGYAKIDKEGRVSKVYHYGDHAEKGHGADHGDDSQGDSHGSDYKEFKHNKIFFKTSEIEVDVTSASGKYVDELIEQAHAAGSKIYLEEEVGAKRSYKDESPLQVGAQGEELSKALIKRAKSVFVSARTANGKLRRDNLSEQWAEAKAEHPDLRGWQIQKEYGVDVDLEAIKDRLVPMKKSLVFKVEPATTFYFKPSWITEGESLSKLKDNTILQGELQDSPMVISIDGLDFQHLVMKAEERQQDPETIIEKSWVLKDENTRQLWEVHKMMVVKLEEKLLEEYGAYKKDDEHGRYQKGDPKRVPTEKDHYRIDWQQIVAYGKALKEGKDISAMTYDEMKELRPGPVAGFTGPNHKTMNEYFPELSIPRNEVRFDSTFTPKWNTYYALYFTITGLHGLHVIGGGIVLGYYMFFGRKMYESNPDWLANRVEVGGLFWHFVDLVWIFLFPILYLM